LITRRETHIVSAIMATHLVARHSLCASDMIDRCFVIMHLLLCRFF